MYGEPLRLGGHPLRANGRVCRVAPGALSVPPYVSESCVPGGGSAGGSSIVMVCWVPGPLSLGCSFATLSAAHREMHSRLQPQEQETSQRHSGPGTIQPVWDPGAQLSGLAEAVEQYLRGPL
jgi:hypothetical protein